MSVVTAATKEVLTDVELAAVASAKRRLSTSTDPYAAYAALRVLVAAAVPTETDDPPIAKTLTMPAWTRDTGAYLALLPKSPLLDLMGASDAT